mgnify:CR=1 FL=1
MNLDRLLPKTSFGRFFLINVISLALFWLLIQPMANYWRNQALFRMVASNESRLFLTHIRLLDKLPTIAERNGLFNPNDDVFSIRVSHLPPDMPRDGSNCSQSLRRRLERAFKQENIRYTDLLTRIVVSHAPITVMGSEEKYSDLETFLTHHYMQAEIALRRPDGIWIYAKHQIEIMPQNRLWLNTAALAIEFLLVMSGVALALNWLLRPLRKLVAATERFGRTQEITPLRTDSGPVEVREAASAFNRMFSSIQRSFEERERFLTSFSHDLRTPLTRLRLRLEQVAQDDLREKLCADVDDYGDDYCSDTPKYSRPEYMVLFNELNKPETTEEEWKQLEYRTSCSGVRFRSTNVMDYYLGDRTSVTADQRDRIDFVLNHSPLIPRTSTKSVADRPLADPALEPKPILME